MPVLGNALKRFESRFVKSKEGCWNWLAKKDGDGYGRFNYFGGIRAHIFSYKIYRGKVPSNQCVLHKCDNPSCVNPEHLFLGSRADNMKDMVSKGRGAKGERQGRSKLTRKDVLEIRDRYCRTSHNCSNAKNLAIEYGVSWQCIIKIARKRNWKHV